MTYLIETQSDGAHCRKADTAEVIWEQYEALPGDEFMIEDAGWTFVYKQLAGSTTGTA